MARVERGSGCVQELRQFWSQEDAFNGSCRYRVRGLWPRQNVSWRTEVRSLLDHLRVSVRPWREDLPLLVQRSLFMEIVMQMRRGCWPMTLGPVVRWLTPSSSI